MGMYLHIRSLCIRGARRGENSVCGVGASARCDSQGRSAAKLSEMTKFEHGIFRILTISKRLD